MDDKAKAQLDKAYQEDLASAKENLRQEEINKLSQSGKSSGGIEGFKNNVEKNVATREEQEQLEQKFKEFHYDELGGIEEVERQNQEWKKQEQEQAQQKKEREEVAQDQVQKVKKDKENLIKSNYQKEFSRINQGQSISAENVPTNENQAREELSKEEKMAAYEKRMKEQFNQARQGREQDNDLGR